MIKVTVLTLLCLTSTVNSPEFRYVEPIKLQVDTLQRDFKYVNQTTDSLIANYTKN